jgi:hypothetical protein
MPSEGRRNKNRREISGRCRLDFLPKPEQAASPRPHRQSSTVLRGLHVENLSSSSPLPSLLSREDPTANTTTLRRYGRNGHASRCRRRPRGGGVPSLKQGLLLVPITQQTYLRLPGLLLSSPPAGAGAQDGAPPPWARRPRAFSARQIALPGPHGGIVPATRPDRCGRSLPYTVARVGHFTAVDQGGRPFDPGPVLTL